MKRRYNAKTYERISVDIPKAQAQAFKSKCKEKDISQAKIVKDAISAFLESEE